MNATDAARALERAAPGLSPALRAAVAERAQMVRRRDGARLFSPGDRAQGFLIPVAGAVRVEHLGSGGRSVVLYRVGAGDSCVMTTSCLIGGGPYQAWGWAEGDLEAIALSPQGFLDLIERNAEFRALALSVFAERIGALVEVIDELLLRRVDLRLATWLAERAPAVSVTHQEIANELGTAREVVSRILKEFERRGWITLARGEIAVLAPDALSQFATGKP